MTPNSPAHFSGDWVMLDAATMGTSDASEKSGWAGFLSGHAPGRRGLWFDAGKRQVVVVPHDEAMNVGKSLTVAAWIKYRIPMPRACVILSRRDYSAVAFQLSVVGRSDSSPPLSIQLYTGEGTTNYSGSVLPEREEWCQVAATLAPQYKQFYFNGRLVDQSGHNRPPDRTSADLWIGACPPSESKSRCWFDGLMDEIWIFQRVLSPSEMRELCALGSPPEPGETATEKGEAMNGP